MKALAPANLVYILDTELVQLRRRALVSSICSLVALPAVLVGVLDRLCEDERFVFAVGEKCIELRRRRGLIVCSTSASLIAVYKILHL